MSEKSHSLSLALSSVQHCHHVVGSMCDLNDHHAAWYKLSFNVTDSLWQK